VFADVDVVDDRHVHIMDIDNFVGCKLLQQSWFSLAWHICFLGIWCLGVGCWLPCLQPWKGMVQRKGSAPASLSHESWDRIVINDELLFPTSVTACAICKSRSGGDTKCLH
jgi:hypothetical protein